MKDARRESGCFLVHASSPPANTTAKLRNQSPRRRRFAASGLVGLPYDCQRVILRQESRKELTVYSQSLHTGNRHSHQKRAWLHGYVMAFHTLPPAPRMYQLLQPDIQTVSFRATWMRLA
jgi:hypothetical protein